MERDKMTRAGPEELSEEDMESVTGGTGGTGIHTVAPGETISMIAKKYGVSSMRIAKANSDTIIRTAQQHGIHRGSLEEYSTYLFAGEQLTIPF